MLPFGATEPGNEPLWRTPHTHAHAHAHAHTCARTRIHLHSCPGRTLVVQPAQHTLLARMQYLLARRHSSFACTRTCTHACMHADARAHGHCDRWVPLDRTTQHRAAHAYMHACTCALVPATMPTRASHKRAYVLPGSAMLPALEIQSCIPYMHFECAPAGMHVRMHACAQACTRTVQRNDRQHGAARQDVHPVAGGGLPRGHLLFALAVGAAHDAPGVEGHGQDVGADLQAVHMRYGVRACGARYVMMGTGTGTGRCRCGRACWPPEGADWRLGLATLECLHMKR